MTPGQPRQRQFPAPGIDDFGNPGPGDHRPDRGYGHAGKLCGLFERLERLIARRIASGHYHDRDPRVVARIIAETVTTFARHIYGDVEPPGFDLNLARKVIIETLVTGIVRDGP